MEVIKKPDGFELKHNGYTLLKSSAESSCVFIGKGTETVRMRQGNFKIEDYVEERIPLAVKTISGEDNVWRLDFESDIHLELTIQNQLAVMRFQTTDSSVNRFWLRFIADKTEHCYGCGEQMSYFDLRGRHFPLWTSEPGVGRDKSTYITWRTDVDTMGGGDYYNTNYPAPLFVSSKKYYVNVATTAYADFDFRNENFHEIHVWQVPEEIRIEAADTFEELLQKETAFLGRQPELPDWIYNGLILGVQGGNERSFGLAKKVACKGVKIAGVWCQDWCGKRVTSFGKRLQWDWHFHEQMYPNLPARIKELHEQGIKFLGYVNPYLVNDGMLYREAKEKGYFAVHSDGSEYLVDFGEFLCGVIDLTNPDAAEWFKNVIKKYSIDIGIDGWMADFGEYLPVDDLKLSNGVSAMVEHNKWPMRWAKCNYDAVKESGKLGKIVYFMRAGGAGSAKYCTLLWAGDQSVDFTRHDGLCTVIIAALSAGMSGCGLTHSDIGGYTSLYGNIRTKELFLRWAEMAVFTPVMRTHEGNRGDENFQFYNDEDCISQVARLVNIHAELKPYIQPLVKETSEKGIPVQRPLFLHYESDAESYTQQFEYLLGRDILVAPVIKEDVKEWSTYLPDDTWIHLWTGKQYGGGMNTVVAKIGYPPVFWRKNSTYAQLFTAIGKKYGRTE